MYKSIGVKRSAAFLATCVLVSQSLVGCGSSNTPNTSNLPAIDDSSRYSSKQPVAQPRQGMSNGKKVALLVGAAALYYMYNKNQQAKRNGNTSQPQYYMSKNGRVYYREKGGRVHWVTPPSEGIQVPIAEASQYQNFQGYEGRTNGRDLAGIGNNPL